MTIETTADSLYGHLDVLPAAMSAKFYQRFDRV